LFLSLRHPPHYGIDGFLQMSVRRLFEFFCSERRLLDTTLNFSLGIEFGGLDSRLRRPAGIFPGLLDDACGLLPRLRQRFLAACLCGP